MSDDKMIHRIPFNGGHIQAVEQDGKQWVAGRPVCDDLGLDWKSQHAKLSSLPWAVMVMITTTGADGKRYEMACVDTDTLLMWLATIHPGKVRPEARPALVAYQTHVKKVIADYFLGRTKTPPHVLAELEAVRRELNDLRHQLSSGVVGDRSAEALIKGVIRQIAMYESLDRERPLSHWRKKTEERVRRNIKHHRRWGLLPRDRLGDAQGLLSDLLDDAKAAAARRNALRQQELVR